MEFTGDNPEEKAVRTAWKELLDLFTNYRATPSPEEKSRELTAELLLAMGKCLGYEFDRVHLKKGAYYPEGLGNVEQEQHALRRGVLELLEGKRRIPVGIFEDKFLRITLQPERPVPPTKAERAR